MGKLVPEQRVDKNGRVVTRHVKSDTAHGGSIPDVTLAGGFSEALTFGRLAPNVKTQVINRILKLTERDGEGYSENYNTTRTLNYLASRAPEELLALDQELQDGDEWLRQNWAATLERITFNPRSFASSQQNRDMLPDFLRTKIIVRLTAELTKDDGIAPDATSLRGSALRGIVSRVPTDDYDSIRAAMVATWILPREHNGTYSAFEYDIHYDSLEYIKASYEQVMAHRRILRERGSIDPEVMEMIINSDTAPLSSGVL